ncbi:MAG: hypothetical protein NZ901_10620 [Geminocystis sp.]|nr:hypothetical protein [Geminocystis sp.]MCS7148629.1 hypothetical protein [Geminocystis sp.]MCX8079403.1 hypothetical protein [Geminocystis sp.]MDW8114979.1 hypothetical protein [Geminocystis sp.]MDW8464247.1 hypothetical protein [Geminocystis sp.]
MEKLKAQNEQIVKRLDSHDKRFDEINSRLNTLTIGFLSIVGVLVTGLLGIIVKIALFPNPV